VHPRRGFVIIIWPADSAYKFYFLAGLGALGLFSLAGLGFRAISIVKLEKRVAIMQHMTLRY
jgi:hypothetical protein